MEYKYIKSDILDSLSIGEEILIYNLCTVVYDSCVNFLNVEKVVTDDNTHVGEVIQITKNYKCKSGIIEWVYSRKQILQNLNNIIEDFISKKHYNKITIDIYDFLVNCAHEVCRIYGQQYSYITTLPTIDNKGLKKNSNYEHTCEDSYGGEVQSYTWKKTTTISLDSNFVKNNTKTIRYYGLCDYTCKISDIKKNVSNSLVKNSKITSQTILKMFDNMLIYISTISRKIINHGIRNKVVFNQYYTNSGSTWIYFDWWPGNYKNTINTYMEFYDNVYTAASKNDDDDNVWKELAYSNTAANCYFADL